MIIPRTASPARSFVSAMAAIGVGIAVLGSAAPASAAPEVPEDGADVELSFALDGHGLIIEDAPLTGVVTAEIAPDSAELAAGRLAVEIDRTALADMTAVDAWLAQTAPTRVFDTVFSAPTDVMVPDAEVEVPFSVPAAALADLEPGVYPIRATISGADIDETVVTRSVVTVRAADDDAPIGVVVPVTATPASGDLLSGDELAVLTAEEGPLTAQLDAVVGTTAALAVDPAIPAAIRVLGTAAPESAATWLTRLEALPNDIFPLQFGDADATAQAQAGLETLLAPASLDVFQNPADIAPSPTPTPGTAGLDPSEPAAPDLAELTAIDGSLDGLLWPRGDATAADLTVFDGYIDSATTLLPSDRFSNPVGAHARVDDSDVLVVDVDLSARFSAIAALAEPRDREPALAQAAAALHFSGSPASGILIGLDRDETRTRDALREVVELVDPIPLSGIRELAPSRSGLMTPDDSTRGADLKMLLEDEERLTAFASIIEEPQLLLAPERIRILRLIAVDHDDETFGEEYRAHRERTAATLDAVAIQEYSGPIQLFSANVDLPVWIRNDLPWPVTLNLEVRPSDARIDVEPFTRVEAVATSNTKVQIPVAARIASGELRVGFSLESPTGVPIGSPRIADVNVRAEWEGIGLAVLGGVIVLLLGFGVLRTVRRRRREAAQAGEAADGDRPASPASESEPS